MIDYNVKKFPWYSPHLVIKFVNILARTYGHNFQTKREFKRAREMFEAAITLLGIYELDNRNRYFMQGNFQSDSPDIMAAKQTEVASGPILLELGQIELVTMDEHSKTNDVVEFLKQNKLSNKKSYDHQTLITLIINKRIQINRQKIGEALKKLNPKSAIYIIGKVEGDSDKWAIFEAWPSLTYFVTFFPSETMKKLILPESIVLHRGLRDKITYSEPAQVVSTAYQLFNINEKDIEKYRILPKQ